MKNIKYLLFCSIFLTFVFVGNFVSAQTVTDQIRGVISTGSACGLSGEGKCQKACGPNDDIIYPTTALSLGQDTCTQDETCCVPTVCGRNSVGQGSCISSGSCNSEEIGINTSDCLPPKLCCTVPRGLEISPGEDVNAPNNVNTPTSGAIEEFQSDIFTGEQPVSATSGTSGGLVPCDGFDCTICDVFTLIKNLINLLTELVFAFAAGFIVWGAIEIMTAGGAEERVKSGKEKVTTAIYGVAIALSAWMLIGTALQVFTGSTSYLPWNKIQCSSKAIWKKPIISNQSDTDTACFAKGGSCRNIKTLPCDGEALSGLCKTSSDVNYKCCIPKALPTAVIVCKGPQHQCLDPQTDKALIIRSTIVAGEDCPDKTKTCYDVGTEPGSPSAIY